MRVASNLRDTAWVESPAGAMLSLSSSPPVDSGQGELVAFHLWPNDVSIVFRSPGAGMLVMSDSYSPGWTALVNEQAAPILRVDGALRGIQLPSAGEYRISMHYRPPHWDLILLLVGLGAALVTLATCCRYQKLDRSSESGPAQEHDGGEKEPTGASS
jgi:hypothetical protein